MALCLVGVTWWSTDNYWGGATGSNEMCACGVPSSCSNGKKVWLLSSSHTATVWESLRVLPCITSHLDPKQFAISGKSTHHALVYLLHIILEAIDRGDSWFFADFKKGFDLIGHQIMIKRNLLSIYNLAISAGLRHSSKAGHKLSN